MDGNNEVTQHKPQRSIGQNSRIQNRSKSRQIMNSPRTRMPIKTPTDGADDPNASGVIEQHQAVPSKANSESVSVTHVQVVNQSNEAGDDKNGENFRTYNSNRRRGPNAGYRSDKRGDSRDGNYNQDRRYNSSRNTRGGNGANEKRNGQQQFAKGGNNFRGSYRRRGPFQDSRTNCTTEGDNNQKVSVSHSDNICSSPTVTKSHSTVTAKPNAWTDNAYPITKAFESPSLKDLLPGSTEEEIEMYERAVKLSLEEQQRQHENYLSHPIERKCSNSSESEVFINEVEEAKKMLQANNFPPLSMSTPDTSVLCPAVVSPPESGMMTQHFTNDGHGGQNASNNFARRAEGENRIDQVGEDVWDRFGARPKKKGSMSAGRGFGRGRKGSEGKIGELVASSASNTHSPSVVRSVLSSSSNSNNLRHSPCNVELEQFEAVDVSSVVPTADSDICATQIKTSAIKVPSEEDVQSVDTMCKLSKSSISKTLQRVQVANNAAKEVQSVNSTAQQVKILDKTMPQVKELGKATLKVTESGRATQPAELGCSLAETTSMHNMIPTPVQLPLVHSIAEEKPQHDEFSSTLATESDHSKDEEIRALKEEVSRLKQARDVNHHEAAHFPPPYGVLPFHVPYIVPMPYYRYPFSSMPLPVVRNDNGMFDSSFTSVPYMPDARTISQQEMIHMRQTAIPAICNDMVSNSDIVDMPDLNSSLSPTAEVFHPRNTTSALARNGQGYDTHEGRKPKPRPKQQNCNWRGNAKNVPVKYQRSHPSYTNYSLKGTSSNFTSPPLLNIPSSQNSHLPSLVPPGDEFAYFNNNRGYDCGPPAN